MKLECMVIRISKLWPNTISVSDGDGGGGDDNSSNNKNH